MTRLLVTLASAVGLILFVAFIATRLIRSRTRGFSVRMQVFLALAVIVLAFAFGLGLLVVDRVEARARRLALDAASDESHAVAAILESEMRRSGERFEILARDLERWKPVRHTGRTQMLGLELLSPDGQLHFPKGRDSAATEVGAVFVDAKVTEEGEVVGVVRVVKPTIVVQEMLADFAPTVLVISLLLGAVSALAAAWIGRTIAEPIEALSTFSEQVAAGDPTQIPKRVSGREVKRLVSSIDAMRRQLEGRPFVETFAADLSHELKNPVAAIRASAEVLLDGALAEPEQARHFVLRILDAASRIQTLLAELLSLAEVETRGTDALAPLSLEQLLRECLAQAPLRDQVSLKVLASPTIRGDRPWLTRALNNLLDNALTHRKPGSQVVVTISSDAQEAKISVRNEGQISPHVQKDLFRRFVTTRRREGGTGLGLAIVRAVAEAHSGRIELGHPGPPQVELALRLPLA